MGSTSGPSQTPFFRKPTRRGLNPLGLGSVYHGHGPASLTANSGFIIKQVFDENKQGFIPQKAGKREQREREAREAKETKRKELRVKTNVSHIPFPQPDSRKKEDEEGYILVMGGSGAGKTSFINVASGSRLPVSSGLKSCTSNIDLSEPFMLDGKKIRLIDTPGFDDSSRSDADVLGTIADFLAKEFIKGRKLQGILYFHRISDVRIGALSKRNLTMFQKLCGEHSYPNVVLVTSRWSEVNEHVGINRENELKSKAIFFKPLLEAGASLSRYERNVESAHGILRQLLDKPLVTLSIQQETVLERKTIAETEAGMALHTEKLASIQKFEENLRGLTQEAKTLDQNDVDAQRDLEADMNDLKSKMEVLQEDDQRLMSRQSRVDMIEIQVPRSTRKSALDWGTSEVGREDDGGRSFVAGVKS